MGRTDCSYTQREEEISLGIWALTLILKDMHLQNKQDETCFLKTDIRNIEAACDLLLGFSACNNNNNNNSNNGDLCCSQTVKVYDSTRCLQCQIIHL